MILFELEPWEFFEAPTAPKVDGVQPMTTITRCWIDGTRIYGVGPERHEPLWLDPARVPGRVVRRDPGKPRHPLEWRRVHDESHARWLADKARKPTTDEKTAARLVPIAPEVPCRPATLEEIPRGAKTIGVAATREGFDVRATYARGPRFDQHGNFVEMTDSIAIRGRHPDGRRFGAMWITKTPGEGAKDAGIPKWGFDIAYVRGETWATCNATQLSAYLVTSE